LQQKQVFLPKSTSGTILAFDRFAERNRQHRVAIQQPTRAFRNEERSMMAFIGWMVIGLVAGLLARAFTPGRQPMGLFMTMLLGMIGSLIGGVLSAVMFGQDPANPGIHPVGFIGSTIGAIIALAIYLRTAGRPAV
jgi:uncharacterized membrane protein YeaQ/YmgE (transglycosylase-associated protein family)